MVSTFQLSGRPPSSDMRVIRATSSSLKPFMQPSATHSRVVPAWVAVSRHSSSTSCSEAQRLGTGCPSQSLWV